MRVLNMLAIAALGLLAVNNNTMAANISSEQKCAVIDAQIKSKILSSKDKKRIAQIYQLFDDWKQAISASDTKKIASLVTEDAEFWSNLAPPLKGRKALENVFKAFLTKYEFSQNYECYELTLRDDIAFIRGLERNTKKPREGGEAIFTTQRAFSVLRESKNGQWRFARGMTNLPAKAVSPEP